MKEGWEIDKKHVFAYKISCCCAYIDVQWGNGGVKRTMTCKGAHCSRSCAYVQFVRPLCPYITSTIAAFLVCVSCY